MENLKVLIEKSELEAMLFAQGNVNRLSNGKQALLEPSNGKHDNVENIFPFNYGEHVLYNKDAHLNDEGKEVDQTVSRYRVVFGNEGKIINCAKNSYHIVPTLAVSSLAEAFVSEGLDVKPFIFSNGAKIGLKVEFGDRPSKVGKCQYSLIVTVPNDGTGMGYLSVEQLRLICSNGQTRKSKIYKDNNIKIPHTFNYEGAIEVMKSSIQTYVRLLNELENRDIKMAENSLTNVEVLYHLNQWFYKYELAITQKKFKNEDGKIVEYTINDFRRELVDNAENVPSANRYDELKEALERELGHNKELHLGLSMYTVFATITNYLSRRVEKSGSKAPIEIKNERASKKLAYFDNII